MTLYCKADEEILHARPLLTGEFRIFLFRSKPGPLGEKYVVHLSTRLTYYKTNSHSNGVSQIPRFA